MKNLKNSIRKGHKQFHADPFFVQKYILFFLALASSVFYLQMTLTTALCH